MSNAYNTPAYHEYRADYLSDIPLMWEETETFTLHGLSCTLTTRHYEQSVSIPWEGQTQDIQEARTTGQLTVCDRTGVIHAFDLIDDSPRPIALTLRGKDCILLRRGLYGYTLLDADELSCPVLDYFPSAVLEGEEAFIFCDAYALDDLIVLEGCYWASSYGQVFILDPKTGRALDLNAVADIADVAERSIVATPDALTVRDGEEREHCFSVPAIRAWLQSHGQTDL